MVLERLVSFQVLLVMFHGQSWSDVLVVTYNRPSSASRQDDYRTRQDVTTTSHRETRQDCFQAVVPRLGARVGEGRCNIKHVV